MVANWLRANGHEVFSVWDEARGMTDDDVLAKAWRRTRRRGTPIPVELSKLAVVLAERYGVSCTSQALPVGY